MTTPQQQYTNIGTSLPGAEESQMFGKPCFKINSKAFICFFEECMVFKLTGDHHKKALALSGSHLFDPSGKGRAMKEWVQVPVAHGAMWKDMAAAAISYVGG